MPPLTRRPAWLLALALALACGSEAKNDASSGGAAGAGASGGSGAGGVGAGGGGGVGATQDPNYCPPKPYATPPAAKTSGATVEVSFAERVGSSSPDGVRSAAALPGGAVVALSWRKAQQGQRAVLERIAADGSVSFSRDWPDVSVPGPLVAADAAGNVFVAGTAEQPFDFGGAPVAPAADGGATPFVYLLTVDAAGSLARAVVFPHTGMLWLEALDVSPTGAVALAGALWKSADFAEAGTLAVPPYMEGQLPAGFVVSVEPGGAVLYARAFPSSGEHGDPAPLSGQGGTNGFGQSHVTDVTWTAQGTLVATLGFQGALDLGGVLLPNDDDADAALIELDAAGKTQWSKHLHGLIGEVLPATGGTGGVGGQIAPGVVRGPRVAVSAQGTIAWSGKLTSRARLEGTTLDGGGWGHFTAWLGADGAVSSAIADGGSDVAFDASGKTVVWDGSRLKQLDPSGPAWTFEPGGDLLGMAPQTLFQSGTGVMLAGSFFGKLDLGGTVLESAGCADGFLVRCEQ